MRGIWFVGLDRVRIGNGRKWRIAGIFERRRVLCYAPLAVAVAFAGDEPPNAFSHGGFRKRLLLGMNKCRLTSLIRLSAIAAAAALASSGA
jgi:hypothetical protein